MRDAAKPAVARAFVAACLATKKFARNEKGSVVWAPNPNDWILVERAAAFSTILQDADVLEIVGADVTNKDVAFTLWTMLYDRRWMLPRVGGAWVGPDQPKPQYGALPARLLRRS